MHCNEEKINEIAKALEDRGYKKLTDSCKSKEHDDFEYYKAFRYKNGDLKYQIFFEFWNFVKYGGKEWGLSITIAPDSMSHYVGRRDLELSVDWAYDIDRVEKAAEGFYRFIRKVDKHGEDDGGLNRP